MLETVLIGTDFSPASNRLIRCVGELKALGLRQVVLAHVINVADTPGLENAMQARQVPALQRQKGLLEAQGIEVTAELRFGIPARDLNALAEQHAVDAILLGSRGHGLLQSLLGSVAFKLLQVAKRPVLLAPVRVLGEGDDRDCQVSVCLKSFQSILVPTDFSKNSERVIAWLENFNKTCKASVTLLHVIDTKFAAINLSGWELEDYKKDAVRQLESYQQRLLQTGGVVQTELASGTPWKEIVNRTHDERYSLVLMGSHGKGFFQEVMLGSVANEVSRQTELPILLIPDRS